MAKTDAILKRYDATVKKLERAAVITADDENSNAFDDAVTELVRLDPNYIEKRRSGISRIKEPDIFPEFGNKYFRAMYDRDYGFGQAQERAIDALNQNNEVQTMAAVAEAKGAAYQLRTLGIEFESSAGSNAVVWPDGGYTQQRDVTGLPVSSFTPPAWLKDLSYDVGRSESPFAARVTSVDMPDAGGRYFIPGVATSVDSYTQQGEDSNTIGNGPATTSEVTLDVFGLYSSVVVSQQLFDRGLVSDRWLAESCARGVYAQLDALLLAGNGVGGQQPLGVFNAGGTQSVTYTSASPTPQGLLTSIGSALATSARARRLPADTVLVDPGTYYYSRFGAGVQGAISAAVDGYGPRDDRTDPAVSSLGGVSWLIDYNLGTDISSGGQVALVGRLADSVLLRSGIVYDVWPETYAGQLLVIVSSRQYFAFTCQRYAGLTFATGTGFTTQTGF
jgi:hypothetical protein